MNKSKKIIRWIVIGILLVCTVFLVYSIVSDPLGEHDIMLACAIAAGFVALGSNKNENNANQK